MTLGEYQAGSPVRNSAYCANGECERHSRKAGGQPFDPLAERVVCINNDKVFCSGECYASFNTQLKAKPEPHQVVPVE